MPHVWGVPYWNDEHADDANTLLFAADARLLRSFDLRRVLKAYPAMDRETPAVPVEFIDRMDRIPKYVGSTMLQETSWNATLIKGDVATGVAELKQQP